VVAGTPQPLHQGTKMNAPADKKSLLKDANFLRLWAALGASALGAEISVLAIPLVALTVLSASAMEMSWLRVATILPVLLFTLPGGILVDRHRRRPVLIIRSFVESFALFLIPITYLLGVLSMPVVYLSLLLLCSATAMLQSAESGLITTVAGRDNLVDGFSKVNAAESVAQSVAPGLAGTLVHYVSAPLTVLVDAMFTFISGLLLLRIKVDEPKPEPVEKPEPLTQQLASGIGFIWRIPLLRFLLIQRVLWMSFYQTVSTFLLVYAVDDLGLNPMLTGLSYLIGGSGSVLAATFAERAAKGRQTSRCITWGMGLTFLSLLGMMAGTHMGLNPTMLLVVFLFLFALGNSFHTIHYAALRAELTPDEMQGRVFSSMMFFCYLLTPVAVLVGGTMATSLGLFQTLVWIAVYGCGVLLWSLLMHPRSDAAAAPAAVAGQGSGD
jgi:MFS family permease